MNHPFRILCAGLAALGFAAASASAATLVVHNGESIQAAVNKAAAGDVIEVHAGTYRETVYVDKDRLVLRGVVEAGHWPVLEGDNVLNDGVLVAGHGVTIERLWVRRYKGNGIMTQGANNYRLVHNVVEGPCFYAIFPQFGRNGLVAWNTVYGSDDAAIYVGMSESVDVLHNEAYGSVLGIESENSSHILIEDNYVHDNVLGIATTMLPGLPIKRSDDLIIRNNFVVNNNLKNFAPAGAITAAAPSGIGILVLGTDHTRVEGNFVKGNESVGVLVAETNFFVTTPDDKMDPFPDGTEVLRNVYHENGGKPHDAIKDIVEAAGRERGADVMGTGKGHDNCIADRGALSTLGIARFADCAPGATSAKVASMQTPKPVQAVAYREDQKGRLAYLAVCSGCHTYNSKLTGPPMVTIKALYGTDAERLARWIAAPKHVRKDYPEMPSQAYLPEDVRLAVARYILNELNH